MNIEMGDVGTTMIIHQEAVDPVEQAGGSMAMAGARFMPYTLMKTSPMPTKLRPTR